jgi:3-oxoacyl-[acyl-carrier protein] reductase
MPCLAAGRCIITTGKPQGAMRTTMQKTENDSRPVAVVTGAARGIGKAIAAELIRGGYDLAAIDVAWQGESADAKARSWMEEMTAGGARVLPLGGDIADLEAHGAWIDAIAGQMGRIDLLVNNAGIAPRQRSDILDLTPESFDRLQAVNLRGSFFLTQQIARHFLKRPPASGTRRPCIIFITSMSAAVSSTNRAEYCISKSGLSMAAALYADRLAAEGIPVFEIRPGIIWTDMTAPVREKYDRLIAEGLVPQQRWGQPEDIAKAVVALASGAFDYATGAVIEVSGGMNIRRL